MDGRAYVLGGESSLHEASKSPVLHVAGWRERPVESETEREASNKGPPIALGGQPEPLTWKR